MIDDVPAPAAAALLKLIPMLRNQCVLIQLVTHVEIALRGWLRTFISRTEQMAIIAAIHPVADQRPQLNRDAA